jgi:hypothetical protein
MQKLDIARAAPDDGLRGGAAVDLIGSGARVVDADKEAGAAAVR